MVDVGDDWVSVSEAARRLGITRAAIRSRIKHNSLSSMTDNHGNPLVRLPLPSSRQSPPETSRKVPPGAYQEGSSAVAGASGPVSLADVRAMLGEQQAAHNAAMAALERQHRDMVAIVLERADEAAVRAERAERLLIRVLSERARRRWWRFW